MKFTLRCTVLLFGLWTLIAQATPIYRVGVSQMDYLPYSAVDDEGQYRGLHRDLLDRFAAYAGIQFEYLPMPFARSVKVFLSGDLDFQYPDDPAWLPAGEDSPAISYSDPAIPYIDGLLQLSERPQLGIEQLRTVGTIIGFTPEGYYAPAAAGQLGLIEQGSVGNLIEQVLKGRLDGIYLNIKVVAHQLRAQGNEGALVFNPDLPFRSGFYRMSSWNHPELIEQFNQFLHDEREWVATLQKRHDLQEWEFLLDTQVPAAGLDRESGCTDSVELESACLAH